MVRGDLDAVDLVWLHDRCLVALYNGMTTFQVDFTSMTGCPSALFTVLVRVGKAFRQHAGHLQLVGLDDAVHAIVLRQPDDRASTSAE